MSVLCRNFQGEIKAMSEGQYQPLYNPGMYCDNLIAISIYLCPKLCLPLFSKQPFLGDCMARESASLSLCFFSLISFYCSSPIVPAATNPQHNEGGYAVATPVAGQYQVAPQNQTLSLLCHCRSLLTFLCCSIVVVVVVVQVPTGQPQPQPYNGQPYTGQPQVAVPMAYAQPVPGITQPGQPGHLPRTGNSLFHSFIHSFIQADGRLFVQ
jgi:hypothetical protein